MIIVISTGLYHSFKVVTSVSPAQLSPKHRTKPGFFSATPKVMDFNHVAMWIYFKAIIKILIFISAPKVLNTFTKELSREEAGS